MWHEGGGKARRIIRSALEKRGDGAQIKSKDD